MLSSCNGIFRRRSSQRGPNFFCSSAMGQLRVERTAQKLPATRADFMVLFMEELLQKCRLWMNENIALHSLDVAPISMNELYQFVAVLSLSHLTGLRLDKTVTLLYDLGSKTPSLQRVRYISNNIIAYSPTSGGHLQQSTWNVQRDRTQCLESFERSAYSMTCKIFLVPLRTFANLDDDLYGTRASDNQVKTISHRKADHEGHSADAIADALFRITLMVRFRRRGEHRAQNVSTLIRNLWGGSGEHSMHGLIITADRGYGNMNLTKDLFIHDIGSIFIMPEHILKCHPFVGQSFLNTNRNDHVESNDEREPGEVTDDENNSEMPADSASRGGIETPNCDNVSGSEANRQTDAEDEANVNPNFISQADRRGAFIIDDSPDVGPASFFARKFFKPSGGRRSGRSKVTTVAVREHGTKHFSNIIRFTYTIPSAMTETIEKWVAVPKTTLVLHMLFSKRSDEGNMALPPDASLRPKDIVERLLLQRCVVLTIGQRCADWFVLHQFCVTGTSAGKLLMAGNDVRRMIGLDVESDRGDSCLCDVLNGFVQTWFSSTRSTEPMMRGTIKEGVVLAALSQKPYFHDVYECGMLARSDSHWMACSPDAVALIDTSILAFECGIAETEHVQLAPVEIKTSVARSRLDCSLGNTTIDVVICFVGDNTFHQYIVTECSHSGSLQPFKRLHSNCSIRIQISERL